MKRLILCLLAVALAASATTLSGAATADNGFWLYLSTSPTVTGTLITSGGDWGSTYSFSGVALTPGTTYYLQIDGYNAGGPGSIIGSFTLSDSSFQFANGSQSLVTDTADWTYSYTGFGANAFTPTDWGGNGVAPWGYHSGIDASARWIWDSDYNYSNSDLYFTAVITPTGGATPEPASVGLFGAGFVALGLMARRKRSA